MQVWEERQLFKLQALTRQLLAENDRSPCAGYAPRAPTHAPHASGARRRAAALAHADQAMHISF
jgi:hypothetical protein